MNVTLFIILIIEWVSGRASVQFPFSRTDMGQAVAELCSLMVRENAIPEQKEPRAAVTYQKQQGKITL